MLTKVVFPNPFGFPKPEQTEVLILQETYHFSNEYAKFLCEQNGFNDLVFFESDYNNIFRRRTLATVWLSLWSKFYFRLLRFIRSTNL